ncbi:hypothetical protein BDZ45DRAFT_541724, partial [Acephala macrosclerotiorum]
MSFGWSAGDIFAAGKLLIEIGKALSDANGAPQHFRDTIALFPTINSQLRILGRMLCNTLAKGADMGLDLKPGLPSWPKAQLKKLQWHFLEKEGVDALIKKIFQQTQQIPTFYQASFYATIICELVASANVCLSELIEKCHDKLYFVSDSILKQQLRHLDSSIPSKLLRVGPEDGILEEKLALAPELHINSALAHLEDFAYKVMDNKTGSGMPNLKVDHVLCTAITSWLTGLASPRLCLQGTESTKVSAVIYNVALEKERAIVAFASRHAENGKMLSYEERMCQLVYSILFQLLQLLPEESTFAIPDMQGSFSDLDLFLESMPLALRYMKYFLDLVPQCIVLVDKFQYLSDSKNTNVDEYLKAFLHLFETQGAEGEYRDDGYRLVLSTSGKERM